MLRNNLRNTILLVLLQGNLEITIRQCILIITLCLSVVSDIWDLTQELSDLFEQIGSFTQSLISLGKQIIITRVSNYKWVFNNRRELDCRLFSLTTKWWNNLWRYILQIMFCHVDNFFSELDYKTNSITNKYNKPECKTRLHRSEIITIIIGCCQASYDCSKNYYLRQIWVHHKRDF